MATLFGGFQLPIPPFSAVMFAKYAAPHQPARDRTSWNGHLPEMPNTYPFGTGGNTPIARQIGRARSHGEPRCAQGHQDARVSLSWRPCADVARLGGPERGECGFTRLPRPPSSLVKLIKQG